MNSQLLYTMDAVKNALAQKNIFVITDTNVSRLYPFVLKARGTVVEAGEQSKSPKVWANIIAEMTERGCNRKTVIIAVGGGVIGDLAGFTAATFMRGIDWICIPTTLLAQVDSSIGGKTAVDVCGYKNVAGAFWLPKQIIIADEWLKTLPEREIRCGEGEVLKTALLDREIFDIYRKSGLTAEIINACAQYKKGITEKDFTETGLRKILNLGHTVGHAIEREDKCVLSHGEYVAMGIAVEFFMFRDEIDSDFYDYAVESAAKISPVIDFDPEAIAETALKDKKNSEDKAVFVIAVRAGETKEMSLSRDELNERLKAFNKGGRL